MIDCYFDLGHWAKQWVLNCRSMAGSYTDGENELYDRCGDMAFGRFAFE